MEGHITQFPNCDYNLIYGILYRVSHVDKYPHPVILLDYSRFLDQELPIQEEIMKQKIKVSDVYTKEEFIKDTIPSKRKTYSRTLADPDKIHIVPPNFELIVKTDEHQPGT